VGWRRLGPRGEGWAESGAETLRTPFPGTTL